MRLDIYLYEKKYFDSREKAKQAVLREEVFIDGRKIKKPSYDIDEKCDKKIEIIAQESFVSLGGYKLNKALKDFNISVKGLTACDLGVSCGGFTDCLIQNGIKYVYAVDVSDLLHKSLKQSDKVKLILKNVKDLSLKDFNDKIDIVTADLSFISSSVAIPVINDILSDNGIALILVKPQFEVDKKIKFKNGIIKDDKIVKSACEKIYKTAINFSLSPINITSAGNPKDKNREYILFLKKNCETIFDIKKIDFNKL